MSVRGVHTVFFCVPKLLADVDVVCEGGTLPVDVSFRFQAPIMR